MVNVQKFLKLFLHFGDIISVEWAVGFLETETCLEDLIKVESDEEDEQITNNNYLQSAVLCHFNMGDYSWGIKCSIEKDHVEKHEVNMPNDSYDL